MSEDMVDGWSTLNFGALCTNIVNGGTPDTGNLAYWNGNTPWITGADFTLNGIGDFRRFVSSAGVQSSATSVIKQGNILVVTRTGVGKLAIAPCDIAISQDITGIYIDASKAETKFIYYLLSREIDELKKLNQGTSINGIVRSDLERHLIRLPHKKYIQKKIAAILSTIDIAIEKTEALIAKYQQIKAGLMHDLFTRGVLPNGQLRPPRSQAPELYQETVIGWIPKDWELVEVEKLCSAVVDCPHSTPVYEDTGYPCIRTADMVPGALILEQAYKVSAKTFHERVQRLTPKSGDIIYSREGERLGIASPVGTEPVCLGQRVMMLRPAGHVDSEFLLWAMNTPTFYRQVTKGLGATTSPHVNVGDIKRILLPAPPLLEQQQIGAAISKAHQRIRHEQMICEKLWSKKRGLMQGLLTGKVPVQIDELDTEVTA